MSPEDRLAERGLVLPPEPKLPPNVSIPFEWVRVVAERCVISGHGAVDSEGVPAGPFGRVPSEVSLEAAQASAHQAGLPPSLLSGGRSGASTGLTPGSSSTGS
jgi:hypothetical protein